MWGGVEQAMTSVDGHELRESPMGKGDGVFAVRPFLVGDTVMVGVVQRRLAVNHSHASQVSRTEYVELGGLSSKVNHSCDPNCGVRGNPSGGYDLVARRALTPGDEITFDYAMRNYQVEHFPAPCRCGSALCRGVVTGWSGLSDVRKTAYAGLVAPYLLEIDRADRRSGPAAAAPTERIRLGS